MADISSTYEHVCMLNYMLSEEPQNNDGVNVVVQPR